MLSDRRHDYIKNEQNKTVTSTSKASPEHSERTPTCQPFINPANALLQVKCEGSKYVLQIRELTSFKGSI